MNERFTFYSRRSLIRMWRTLKDESGDRVVMPRVPHLDKSRPSLKKLMDRMEERAEQIDGGPWFHRLHRLGGRRR